MVNGKHLINHDSVVDKFREHLSLEYNQRILFSAPFGAGKSTFLNNYFDDKDENHIVFKLYPVNYSVASNEDVFELIKYDLLAELFGRYADKLNLEDLDFSPLLIGQSYLLHETNLNPFAKALLKLGLTKGKEVVEVIEAVQKIYKNYLEYKDKIKSDEISIVDDYVKWCEARKGSIYERDEITALIADLIQKLRTTLNKQTVLLIDDLDRLDPEHIFRLFNVFSAHYDPVTDDNKFGFDKVIFACDYSNIKLMYGHRYGNKVDFKGYIDKFYSTQPFFFDNRWHLRNGINDILNRITPDGSTNSLLGEKALPRSFFVYVLIDLIQIRAITLRDLDKLKTFDLPIQDTDLDKFFGGHGLKPYNFYFLVLIHLLKKIYDNERLQSFFEILKENTKEITSQQTKNDRNYLISLKIAESALIFLIDSNKLNVAEERTPFDIEVKQKTFKITTHSTNYLPYNYVDLHLNNETINVYEFAGAALEVCLRNNLV